MGLFPRIVLISVSVLVLGIAIIMGLAPHPHLDWDQQEQIALFQFWAEVVGFGFAGSSLYLALRRPTLSLILDPETKSRFWPVIADGREHHVTIYVWNPSEIGASRVVVDLEIWSLIREGLGLRFLRTVGDLATLNPSGVGTWSIASRYGGVGWIWHGGEEVVPGPGHLPILRLPVTLEPRSEPDMRGHEYFYIQYKVWGENTRSSSGRIYIRVLRDVEFVSGPSNHD